MSKVTKIVFTGAPCSGKTTCLQRVAKHYESMGQNVIVCPETATVLINEGITRDDMPAFETLVAKRQIVTEDKLLAGIGEKDVLMLLDRGVADCFSYVDSTLLEKNTGLSPASTWQRYDGVLFLESGAISGDYENNEVRCESLRDAKNNHYNLLEQWVGHPHLRYIPYTENIDNKISQLIAHIDGILSEKEIEKKFLIEYPDILALQKYSPKRMDIEQVYLLSDVGTHRIRKWGYNGSIAFYETLKIRITESSCQEYEGVISQQRYNELLKNADPNKNPIIKNRYCFLYNNKYMELDVFPFWDDKAFLEVELLDINENILLPPEIKVIKDVTNDKRYKNNYLASMKL
ncbi:MAG: AAA family ATPase [Eubacteriales bacterium]|nr:AAA family ATPase [Eubacteriales bacterium]